MAPFLHNVIKLASGSIIGQLVVLGTMPVLARLYAPQHFGVAQAALSVLSVLLIVGALRLEIAVLSVADSELDDLFRCAWWLCVVTAGIAMLVSLGAVALNAEWTTEQRMVAILLPLLGLLASWNQLMSYVGLRRHAFGPSSRAKIVQPLCYATTALGVGAIKGNSVGLLLADALGRALTSAYLGRAMAFTFSQLRPPSLGVLRNTLYKHRELAGIGLVSSLINAAGSAFTAAMLLWLFGAYEAGQYSMVERMVGMPIGLLATSISQVFMANLSKAVSRGDLREAQAGFRHVLSMQLLTGIAVALLIFFVAPVVLDFLLGKGWETAGAYVRALTLLYLCAYIAGPLNMTLTVLGRQRIQLFWDCLRVVIVVSTWGAIWANNVKPENALLLYSISAFVAYATYLLMADWALRHSAAGTRVSA